MVEGQIEGGGILRKWTYVEGNGFETLYTWNPTVNNLVISRWLNKILETKLIYE